MDQRRGNEVGSRRHDHLVERSVLGPAVIAVGDLELDIGAALLAESLLCLAGKLFDDLDAVHHARQLREDCGLVAEAGADLQHSVLGADIEQIRHQRDDKRLRDRLLETDGKRNVGIGVWLEFDRHELVSRHLGHGRHHAFVERRLADHVAHVKYTGGDFREHMLTEDFKVFRTHCAILRPHQGYVALGASERRVAPLGNVGETCSAFHRQLSRTER